MKSEDRPKWSNKIEYMLTTLGYSVGIGNLMRFPYICMQNGGGAFLIPYTIFLFLCATPLFLAEITMGQFTSLSVVGIWNFASFFKGLGWCMIAISGFSCIYYVLLLAWVLYYLGMSFTWILPWSHCNNTWNTELCYSYNEIVQKNVTFENYKVNNMTWSNDSKWRSSAEEFYLFKVLNITPSINELGGIKWDIFICFLVAWLISYLCLLKSTETVGKVVYVTVTLPYILITVFIIRGAMLPGSLDGIKFYIIPKWKSLLNMQVWITAAGQIFYSLGPSWGGIIVMASYNDFHANIIKRAIVLPVICCLTSIYGGFALFSIIGHMAYLSKIDNIQNVVDSGFGLAFVAYPGAMALLPGSTIWSILFFVTLFTLGIDSMFSTYETYLQGIQDEFPWIKGYRKHVFVALSTVVLIFLGIPFTTRAGAYLFQIVDWYSSPIAIILIAIIETVVVTWFYNVRNLINHIEMMMNSKINRVTFYWIKICFIIFTPASLLAIFIGLVVNFEEPKFNKTMKYPRWAISIGWFFAILLILPIPLKAIHEIYLNWPSWKRAFRPNQTFKSIVSQRLALVKKHNNVDFKNGVIEIPLDDNIFIDKSVIEETAEETAS